MVVGIIVLVGTIAIVSDFISGYLVVGVLWIPSCGVVSWNFQVVLEKTTWSQNVPGPRFFFCCRVPGPIGYCKRGGPVWVCPQLKVLFCSALLCSALLCSALLCVLCLLWLVSWFCVRSLLSPRNDIESCALWSWGGRTLILSWWILIEFSSSLV